MKIRRLRIGGFGGLKGDFIFSSDRCNLVLEPNEAGKSTLAAAILASLYGFPRQRASRERPITMKEQHRPWSGGPYTLEMDLTCRDRVYTIRRDFDHDTAAVLDGTTGKEITAEFSRSKDSVDLGESLTGLSRDDFSRCCFVGQRDIQSLRDAQGITHALQRIASSQKGDVAAGEALVALERAVDQYEGMLLKQGKVDTEIRRLQRDIDEVRSEMEEIASRRRASEDKIRRLEEATVKEGRAEADLARVDLLHLLAALREAQDEIERVRADAEEIRACREEIARLEPYASFPRERLDDIKEIRTKLDALLSQRAAAEAKIHDELELPLARVKEAMQPLAGLSNLTVEETALAANRQAILSDLWEQRRDRRRAIRKEERRLALAGVDPGRVTELAAEFSGMVDEERRFVAGFREKMLELKAALSEMERERDRMARAEGPDAATLVSLAVARRAETIFLSVGFVLVLLAPVLWYAVQSPPLAIAAFLAGLGGFFVWARLQEKRPVHGAEEFGTHLQRLQTEIWSREKELAALQERLSNISSRIGYPRPERLLEEFRELELLQEKAAPLAQLAASLREIQNRFDTTALEVLDLMRRGGRPPEHRLVSPRIARRFRLECEEYAAARARAETLRTEIELARRRSAELDSEIAALREAAVRIHREALGPGASFTDLAASVSDLAEAAARAERRATLTREVLPSLLRRNPAPPEERIAALTREVEILTRQVERASPQGAALEGVRAERSSREYVDERRRLQEEARNTQRERLALAEELGDVLKEYRRDYPGRQSLLANLEAALARATAFRDAVGLATEVLQGISKEAYAQWAEVLNDRTGEIIRRITPGYEEILFDTDLTFTVRDARTGRRLDQNAIDAHFSAGTRDQIYLAVRMGVSDYLSSAGARLPFILDDPLATFDDERFERAMEFLVDTVARRHQVIVLSCHEVRHRRWLEKNAERRADSVRVLDLTPLST